MRAGAWHVGLTADNGQRVNETGHFFKKTINKMVKWAKG